MPHKYITSHEGKFVVSVDVGSRIYVPGINDAGEVSMLALGKVDDRLDPPTEHKGKFSHIPRIELVTEDISWCSDINWAGIATRATYVIDEGIVRGDDGEVLSYRTARVWKRTVSEGKIVSVELLGALSDPKVQTTLAFAGTDYTEPEEVVLWDVWREPDNTDHSIPFIESLPIGAILAYPSLTRAEALEKFSLHFYKGEKIYYIRRTSHRNKIIESHRDATWYRENE